MSTPPVGNSGNQIKLDWRQLQKWNIPDDRIPPGSAVLFQTPGAWQEHRTAIVLAACFLLLQSGFIGLLLADRRKLAAARTELINLSSSLISAQDDERARIARELHDDLSQRLALFSIEIDQIREEVRGGSAEQSLRNLSDKAVAMAEDTHGMAHGLYPAKLDHLGLMPAVCEFCREVELRSGVNVEVTTNNWPDRLDNNITLCLYRIVQESLQNVVRHSKAQRAELRFDGRNHGLSLTIVDDGRGFDMSAVPEGSGLAGMHARLRGVQGQISIQSKPGMGTRIEVSIPILEKMSGGLSGGRA